MKRALTVVLVSGVVACSTANESGLGPDANTGGHHDGSIVVDAPVSHGDAATGDAATAAKPTIFTIVLENMDYNEIVGSTNAPYINSLIAMGGLATNYKDTGHPSLPNYLHMISGDNQYPGFIDVGPNFIWFPANHQNLGTQLAAAHISWRSYQESMGTPCNLSDSGSYATKHNPFVYFTDMQMGPNNMCSTTNVDFTQFAADLASNNYRYQWITPNLIHDGHDPSTDPVTGLHNADAWMSTVIPTILASPGYTSGGVIMITWDESEGRNGDDPDLIPMVILSPKIKTAGMHSAIAYTHSSYLATVEDLLGLPRLATVTNAASMKSDFLNP